MTGTMDEGEHSCKPAGRCLNGSAGQHVASVCRAHVWHLPGPPQWTGAELPGRTQLLPALPREGAVERSQVPNVPRGSDAPSCQEPSARGADRSPTCPLPVVQQPADQGHPGCSPGPVQQPPCLVCGPLCLERHPGVAGHPQEYLCPVPGGPGGAGADGCNAGAIQRRVCAPGGAAEDSCAGDSEWHSGKLHASPGSSTSEHENTEQAICIHAGCQHRCDTQQEHKQEQGQEWDAAEETWRVTCPSELHPSLIATLTMHRGAKQHLGTMQGAGASPRHTRSRSRSTTYGSRSRSRSRTTSPRWRTWT